MTWYAAFSPLRPLAWKAVIGWVRRSFPAVRTISTAELANRLAQNPTSLTLIDARQAKEYAVSHLPQAQLARTVEAAEAAGISKEKPIVAYCSIGYRSGRLAQALQAAGYKVMNLEGSIFQWANEGRPLFTDEPPAGEQPTRQVHPYNALWGLLLAPSD
ncbi:MAG: rhodanese-like domain-containing protein [Phormidesmis sp.]